MQFFAGELKSKIRQCTVQLLLIACDFLLACRLSMAFIASNLYAGCTCTTCLRFAYMFIAHTWHIIACNL